uniref:SH3 domain-containing protein n=1 Tax=Panagrellus redivivus TaxID=6233 RepID=A0A7E4V739_PANRE
MRLIRCFLLCFSLGLAAGQFGYQQTSQQRYQSNSQQFQPQQRQQGQYSQNSGGIRTGSVQTFQQNGQTQFGQQQQQQQPQFGSNGQFFNNNGGQSVAIAAQPGLLSNPTRTADTRVLTSNASFHAAAAQATGGQATLWVKINQYTNNGGQMGDGTQCTTLCSFAFTFVVAALDASVYYDSTGFFSFNRSQGGLTPGTWTDANPMGVGTMPITVDIFVHSLGFMFGESNGTTVYLRAPVVHVDTFIINLRNYSPYAYGSTAVTPITTTLSSSGSTYSNSLGVSYYVQCHQGYMGPYCDQTCTPNGSGDEAICTSTIVNQKSRCQYTDTAKTQVKNCTICYGVNGECAVAVVNASNVSHAWKVWTIVLAVLLALALLLILLLILLKLCTDARNRRAQQYPQNRNPSAYSGNYRPNAESGAAPLLGGTEKAWERERQPAAVLRRPAPIPEVDSTQNSESFQESRPNHGVPYAHSQPAPPPHGQQRREAQV